MKLRSLCTLVLFCAGLSVTGGLFAQATVGEITFLPPTFYVGDLVEMTIEFSLSEPLAIEEPQIMPDSDWADILDITAESNGSVAKVTIQFIPFAPGTRTLPDMELGALQIMDLKVPTRSVLSGSHEGVRTLRGQRLLPGTRVAFALILTLLAMAPFLGFGLFRFMWRQGKKFRESWRVGRPARKLRRLLSSLRQCIGDVPPIPWFSALTEGLRTYMSSRLGRDCTSATTAEIALMAEFRNGTSPQLRLLEILKEGDMVKFAGQFADDRSLGKTLDIIDSSVQEWEAASDQL